MSCTTIRNALTIIREGYFRLQGNQRLYVNAIAMLAVFLVSTVVMGFQGAKGVFYLFLVFWVAAICSDLIGLFNKIYESNLGKGFLVVLFSLCTNLAIVLSELPPKFRLPRVT